MTQSNNITFVGINLVRPAKFFLCDKPVNIYIPLPKVDCSNWSDNHNHQNNIGVLYKGQQVTLKQLRYIVKCFENVPDYDIHPSFKNEKHTFDGHVITVKDINEIKRILEAVEKKKPRDRYGDKREFKRDETLIL
jgi:hypothetical protein